jgi:hypothetical protein
MNVCGRGVCVCERGGDGERESERERWKERLIDSE